MITINQSNQEVFDIVVAHLLSMKHKSVSLTGGCAYRGFDGSSCAIGKLISDEDYTPSIEGFRVLELTNLGRLNPVNASLNLLVNLQYSHDNFRHWDEDGFNFAGIDSLFKIAHIFNLGISEECANEISRRVKNSKEESNT